MSSLFSISSYPQNQSPNHFPGTGWIRCFGASRCTCEASLTKCHSMVDKLGILPALQRTCQECPTPDPLQAFTRIAQQRSNLEPNPGLHPTVGFGKMIGILALDMSTNLFN